MAQVPAGTITRLTIQYDVQGVQCFSSMYVQQTTTVEDSVWLDDMLICLTRFSIGLRNLVVNDVEFVRAISRALDAPGVYPGVFNFTGINGTIPGAALPPICYIGVNLFGVQPETTKKRRNQIRVSGLSEAYVQDNAYAWGIVDFMRNFMEQNWLPSLYVGPTNTYNWILAHTPIGASSPTAVPIESINVRPEVYTLQSRKS